MSTSGQLGFCKVLLSSPLVLVSSLLSLSLASISLDTTGNFMLYNLCCKQLLMEGPSHTGAETSQHPSGNHVEGKCVFLDLLVRGCWRLFVATWTGKISHKEVYDAAPIICLWFMVAHSSHRGLSITTKTTHYLRWRAFTFIVKVAPMPCQHSVDYAGKACLLLWRWTFSISSLICSFSRFWSQYLLSVCSQVGFRANHRQPQQSASRSWF